MTTEGRRALRHWLQRFFAVALLVGLAVALANQWPGVRPHLRDLSLPALVGSLAALAVAQLFAMLGWRVVVSELGSHLHLAESARIYFVGQVGKYLPGSVWPVLAQMDMGRDAGVPRTRMGVSFVLSLLVSVVVGLGMGLPTLLSSGQTWLPGVAVVVIGLPIVLFPGLVNRALSRGLTVAGRPPLERGLSRGAMLRSAALYGLSWTFFGVSVWCLVVDVGGSVLTSLPVSIAAFAVAANLGTLFIIAPAGAGVREVLLVVGLAPVLASSPATAVAVVSRLLVTVADVGSALVALATHRHHQVKNRSLRVGD